jgi:hypothetical protein
VTKIEPMSSLAPSSGNSFGGGTTSGNSFGNTNLNNNVTPEVQASAGNSFSTGGNSFSAGNSFSSLSTPAAEELQARALYDYTAEDDRFNSFVAGDILTITQRGEAGGWSVSSMGPFPTDYVEFIVPEPKPSAGGKGFIPPPPPKKTEATSCSLSSSVISSLSPLQSPTPSRIHPQPQPLSQLLKQFQHLFPSPSLLFTLAPLLHLCSSGSHQTNHHIVVVPAPLQSPWIRFLNPRKMLMYAKTLPAPLSL